MISAHDTGCGWIDGQVGHACDCSGIPAEGRCEGASRVYCDEGQYAQELCDQRGLSCGFVETTQRFDCMDAGQDPEPDPKPDPQPNDGSAPGDTEDRWVNEPAGESQWIQETSTNSSAQASCSTWGVNARWLLPLRR